MISQVSCNYFKIISLLVISAFVITALAGAYSVTPEGPVQEIYLCALNILNGGDFSLPEYEKYHQLFSQMSMRDNSAVWQDIYSLDSNGQRVLKHPHLMALILVPFLYLGGTAGLVFFSAMCVWWLLQILYCMLTKLIGRTPSSLSAYLLVAGTPFVFYAYSPSYDLLIVLLSIAGLFLMLEKPLVAGILLGLPVFLRPIAIIPALFFLLASQRGRGVSRKIQLLVGLALVGCAYSAYNYYCWGSPLASPHQRMPLYVNGEVVFNPSPTSFSLAILLSDWPSKLFGFEGGFLIYNVTLFCLVFSLPDLIKSPLRRELWCYIVAALVSFLLVYSYEGWKATLYGSRYLLVSHALLSLVALVGIESFLERNRLLSTNKIVYLK